MSERNETRYQLEQENKIFILTTSLINDKLKIKCQEVNGETFVGAFNMSDLLRLSRYFNSTRSVEQIQIYLNGIIEKQRVGVFPEENSINIVLYLINQDKIYIPLTQKLSNNNNFYNIGDQYLKNQKNNIITQTLPNYPQSNNYSNHQVLENLYQQNSNQYINNMSTQPFYLDQNLSTISDIPGVGAYSIQGINDIASINNPVDITNYNLSPKDNKSQLASIPNLSSYPQADASNNNYNFQLDENKIGKLEDDTNIIRLEHEKIKNEMKRVLDEATNLRKENELYKTENASLINKNANLENKIKEFKVQLLNSQNEIKKYKDENNALRNQFANIQNDSNIFQTQNNKLLKIKEEYETNIQSLKNSIDQMNKENESLREEIEELKQNFNIVSNDKESLVNDINILKTTLENQQKASINEDEIKRLIEENSIFRIKAQENELLKKQIEDLQYQIQMSQEKEEYDENNEVKGDIIHDMRELEMITKKINKENKKVIINLLYKASADGDRASIFHEKCDNAKSTIVLVETKNGMRFGGYTTCSWSGNCVDKTDTNAFIFSFDKMKTYDNIPGDEAIGCYPKFGPIFLGCQIKINDNFFTKGGTTFEKELNFNTEEDYELTNGDREFEVKDIEVYEVIIE